MSQTEPISCKIDLIAGTRPNVIKIAPLYKALVQQSWCAPRIIYLGQHSAPNMSADLFGLFGIEDEAVRQLPLAGTTFGGRLGQIIDAYSALVAEDRPDMVVVPGDVDVSLGVALAARRAGIRLVHLEAGLRSYDNAMPEESNRVLIDSISDLLLAPSEASAQNLIYREGRSHREVHFVGNIMIDSLVQVLDEEVVRDVLRRFDLTDGQFGILTLHRPSNVDDPATLETLLAVIADLAEERTILFPVHPRTRKALGDSLGALPANLVCCDPVDYVSFINLISRAAFFITDSGGVQEETSYLGVPCFTFRENTERPITVYEGTNQLVNLTTAGPIIRQSLSQPRPAPARLPLWDGMTAWRVSQILQRWWSGAA